MAFKTGDYVTVEIPLASASVFEECVILDLPSNKEPKACPKCKRPGCKEFQTLGFAHKAGILRYVSECQMEPMDKRRAA